MLYEVITVFTQARTGLPAASQVYYAGYATNGQA